MIKIFPSESVVLLTGLGVSEVTEKLNAVTKRGGVFSQWSSAVFLGQITRSAFKVTLRSWYSNAFAPVALGEIQKTANGTRIEISMRQNLFVMGFLSIWFGGIIFISLVSIATFPMAYLGVLPTEELSVSAQKAGAPLFAIFALVMGFFGSAMVGLCALLVRYAWNLDVEKIKEALKDTLSPCQFE